MLGGDQSVTFMRSTYSVDFSAVAGVATDWGTKLRGGGPCTAAAGGAAAAAAFSCGSCCCTRLLGLAAAVGAGWLLPSSRAPACMVPLQTPAKQRSSQPHCSSIHTAWLSGHICSLLSKPALQQGSNDVKAGFSERRQLAGVAREAST
jgi:hypothetical protein